MTKHTWVLVGVMVIGLSSLSGVGAQGRKNALVPVTTTIADRSEAGIPFRVGSDGKGVYITTFVKRQEEVKTAIMTYDTGTDWWLTTYYGINSSPSPRTVFFDLSEPASTSNPVPPFTSGNKQAHLIAKCRLVNVNLYAISPGSFRDCPGSFRFQADDGSWYRFSFNPDNFSQVDRLRFTCLSSDSGGCKVWTITPANTRTTGTDSNPKGLHKLLLLDGDSDAIKADFGDYYLSFSITVAR